MDNDPKCPKCGSQALYRYGKSHNGKRRMLCLNCNRQFVIDSRPSTVKDRPRCPICGKKMHVYKYENNVIRFRCSSYPECRTFVKVDKEA